MRNTYYIIRTNSKHGYLSKLFSLKKTLYQCFLTTLLVYSKMPCWTFGKSGTVPLDLVCTPGVRLSKSNRAAGLNRMLLSWCMFNVGDFSLEKFFAQDILSLRSAAYSFIEEALECNALRKFNRADPIFLSESNQQTQIPQIPLPLLLLLFEFLVVSIER